MLMHCEQLRICSLVVCLEPSQDIKVGFVHGFCVEV